MKNYSRTKTLLPFVLCLSIIAALPGCCVRILNQGCACFGSPQIKRERTERVSAPLAPSSTLAVKTHNGSITITAADVSDCNAVATIKAWAGTEQEAQELAERVKIQPQRWLNKLTLEIKKPILLHGQSVSVDFNITVPKQTSLDLSTRNGAVTISAVNGTINTQTRNGAVSISSVEGKISAQTRNGAITTKDTSGTTQIDTHNGQITCKNVAGNMQISAHNGNIQVTYSQDAPPDCNVNIVTHNGGINLAAPPHFSAAVDISTRNGSIHTNLPITVSGKIHKNVKGTIGAGKGNLYLRTRNGSISIR